MIDLLNKVHFITDKYEEIENITGENFNFFKLFGITTKEVSTHSKFIGELLSPIGSHNLKSTFLKLFLEKIGYEDFIIEDASVKVEKFIGQISADYEEGGSIDIFLCDGKNAIIIENKIFAEDQKKQLIRYNNYGKKNYSNRFKLLYLTLQGKNPSFESIGDENVEYQTLSYEDDIIEWLELCKEKAVNFPVLRETITQYIFILKDLTNQTNSKIMAEEIINTITEDENNLKSFFNLRKDNVVRGVKEKLLTEFKKQMDELSKELDLSPKFDEKFGLIKDPTYLIFNFKNSKNGFYIGLCFCGWDKGLVYQVDCDKDKRSQFEDEVIKNLPERDKKFNEIWIKWFENDLKDWELSVKPWVMIKDGRLKGIIKEKFEEIMVSLENIEK